MEIVLGRIKLPPSLICRALKTCDLSILKPDLVISLNGMCPSEADVKLVLEYNGDRSALGAPEKFVEEISKVP